jgi:hypothetical protein
MATFKNKDFEYFVNNYQKIFNKYGHKFIVIKNQKILGVYDDIDDAVDETVKTEEIGTFIVQECTGDTLAYQCSIMRLCIS